MNFIIEVNENNVKSNEKLEDPHLAHLIEYIYDNSNLSNIHNLTNRLFHCYNLKECEEEYNLILEFEESNFNELTHIFNIFSLWNPYEKYNIRELRGFFF